MIPASFEYVRAKTINDALKAAASRDTKLICGGQSLIPLLRFRLAQPKKLVDIGGLAQLKGIAKAKNGIRIGAAVTYREILESKLVRGTIPLLTEVTGNIGDIQIRNIGTIGGGVAHADPAADMPGVLLVLGATFVVHSMKGKRAIAAKDFFKGAFETAMKSSELLVDINVPIPGKSGTAYETFEQPASGYPLVGAAAIVSKAKGKITSATLAFSGLVEAPVLVEVKGFVGSDGGDAAAESAASAAVKGIDANDDIHASSEYRLHLAKVAARRALLRAAERA